MKISIDKKVFDNVETIDNSKFETGEVNFKIEKVNHRKYQEKDYIYINLLLENSNNQKAKISTFFTFDEKYIYWFKDFLYNLNMLNILIENNDYYEIDTDRLEYNLKGLEGKALVVRNDKGDIKVKKWLEKTNNNLEIEVKSHIPNTTNTDEGYPF